jgi:hypothetical protein
VTNITFVDTVAPDANCASGGNITRRWTATDACGASVSGIQRITVQSVVPPPPPPPPPTGNITLVTPPSVPVFCNTSTLPAQTGTATATSTCATGVPTVTFSDVMVPGNCPFAYTIVRRMA